MKRFMLVLAAVALSAAALRAQAAPPADAAKAELERARAEVAMAQELLRQMEAKFAQSRALAVQREMEARLRAEEAAANEAAARAAAEAGRKQAELRLKAAADEAVRSRAVAESSQKASEERIRIWMQQMQQMQPGTGSPKPADELKAKDVVKPAPAAANPAGGEPRVAMIRVLPRTGDAPQALAFSPDGKTLAVGAADAGGTALVRRTHAISKKKAEKLLAFFKEFAGSEILETSFGKGGLVTTTTPALDRLIVGLVALANGQKPAKVSLAPETPGTFSFSGDMPIRLAVPLDVPPGAEAVDILRDARNFEVKSPGEGGKPITFYYRTLPDKGGEGKPADPSAKEAHRFQFELKPTWEAKPGPVAEPIPVKPQSK